MPLSFKIDNELVHISSENGYFTTESAEALNAIFRFLDNVLDNLFVNHKIADAHIFTREKFQEFLDCDCTTSTFPSLDVERDYILERDLQFPFGEDTLQVYLGFLFALSTHRNKLLHWLRIDEQYHCTTPVYFSGKVDVVSCFEL